MSERSALKSGFTYCLRCDDPTCLHTNGCSSAAYCKTKAWNSVVYSVVQCCDGMKSPESAKWTIRELMYAKKDLENENHRLRFARSHDEFVAEKEAAEQRVVELENALTKLRDELTLKHKTEIECLKKQWSTWYDQYNDTYRALYEKYQTKKEDYRKLESAMQDFTPHRSPTPPRSPVYEPKLFPVCSFRPISP